MILNFVPSEFYPIQPWIWGLKKIEMCVSRLFIYFFQFCDMEKMVNFAKPPPPNPPQNQNVVEFTLGKQKFPKAFPSKTLVGEDSILGKLDSEGDTCNKEDFIFFWWGNHKVFNCYT
jgi:hypothetical protein